MDVPDVVSRTKQRWVAAGMPDYPLWIAGLIDSAAVLTAAIAVAQRPDDLLPATALVLLALSPWVLEMRAMGRAWPAFVVLTGGSVAVMMNAYPVTYDCLPALLIVMAGHVTGIAGPWRGAVVTLAGAAVIVVAWTQGNLPGPEAALWTAGVMVGFDLGFIVRTQQQRIEGQARAHVIRERQAVLEERQRIAREVHDLVAHSLSVTMLHLTAARREVEDVDGVGGVDLGHLEDARAALRDAERIGRQAMSDIRGTVGLLGRDDGPAAATSAPAPGLDEIPALLADFRGAGLTVSYGTSGDLAEVPANTALGLYRILQQSLANVAKHAPRAPVRIRLDVARDPGELTVTSDLPRGARRNPGGSGVSGMAERAVQMGARFSAGPVGRSWVVRVELPRGDLPGQGRQCPLPRLVAPFHRSAPGAT